MLQWAMLLKQMKQRKYQQRNRRHIKELDNDSTQGGIAWDIIDISDIKNTMKNYAHTFDKKVKSENLCVKV